MTEENHDEPNAGQGTPAPQPDDATAASPERSRAFSFVTVFVLITMTLLTAYRYAIDTRANDWYLFTVAKHTAWALNFLGDGATLEDPRRLSVSPAEMRASIKAWQSGQETPTPAQIAAASNEPFTPWESWSYTAMKRRHTDFSAEVGPHVQFVWREGIITRLMELEHRRDMLLSDSSGLDEEKRLQIATLTAEISELQKKRMEIIRNPELNLGAKDQFFGFIIIPECGAIEIMAIFFAAVVAFPTSRRKKMIGLLIGVPLMYLVNIFRLSCLGVIGALDTTPSREWFNFTHEYVWQVVYVVFVVIVWLLWVEFLVRRRNVQ